VQADAKQAAGLLQGVRGCGLQVVGYGDDLALARDRDAGAAEGGLHDLAGGELADYDDLVVADVVLQDLEGPLALERFVQAADVLGPLNVGETLTKRTLAGLEKRLGKWALQDLTVHVFLPSMVVG
jgi:hypothetical protein